MVFQLLYLIAALYCCQDECLAQRNQVNVVSNHTSEWNIAENMLKHNINRISGNRKSCSPCIKYESGNFAHTSDCKMFIKCGDHGRLWNMRCAPGTRFNPTTGDCDHPYNILCITKSYTNPDGTCNPNGIKKNTAEIKCGVVKPGNRIIGGHATVPHQYPWMATITTRDQPKYPGCGGSLIKNKWILTAAHCFYFGSNSVTIHNAIVILGHHKLSKANKQYKPKRIIRHKSYTADENSFEIALHANDIALLELEETIQFSQTISAVCLPKPRTNYNEVDATVIGYGATKENEKSKRSSVLNEVEVSTISNKECNKKEKIPSNMMCASQSAGWKNFCSGDSGGPLMTLVENKYVQIGIVSANNGCGKNGAPGVYTKVASYRKWIDKNIKPSNKRGYHAIVYERKN